MNYISELVREIWLIMNKKCEKHTFFFTENGKYIKDKIKLESWFFGNVYNLEIPTKQIILLL